jgi:formate dehydrogenase major subunit
MDLTRRGFLKLTGGTVAAATVANLGFLRRRAYAQGPGELKIKYAQETTSICPYCAVGCGHIVHASEGKIINIEGDPDHPINEGSLCSKGSALFQVAVNDKRLRQVMYRAPNSTEWVAKPWDWALEKIAANIKKTRDESFVTKDAKGRVVNRNEGMACLGGAALDNEECYLYSKFARTLGVVYLEHQARI